MKNKRMEHNLKTPISNKRKVLALIIVSISLMVLPLLIIAIDPINIVSSFRSRLTNNSEIMELLRQRNSPGIHISAYLFNVTNVEQFLSGEDHKLKVQEVGPFTYAEHRNNEDLEFDEAAGVVRYTPRTTVTFLPEESVGDPHEINVTMPNVAMLSMSSMMTEHPYFTRLGFSLLLSTLKSRSLVPQTAHQFLWGYDEPLITLGNTVLPGWISFDTLGIMDRLYDNTIDYRVEIGTSYAERFLVKSVNGYRGMNAWEYEEPGKRSKCNTFGDSYEGIAYPVNFPDGAPVRLFRNVLCRFMPLDYQGIKYLENNVKGLHYKISDNAFNISNDTECMCSKGICIKGISDLSPCFYKLPLALSNAHFLHGDPSLFDRIEGLKPNEEEHGSDILIEPKLGMVLKTAFSVQVNVVVKTVDFNSEAERFSDMVVPVCYFKLVQPEMTEKDKQNLKLLYVIAPYSFWAAVAAIFFCGLLVLVYCIRTFLTSWIYSRDVIVFQAPDDCKSQGIKSSIPLLGL